MLKTYFNKKYTEILSRVNNEIITEGIFRKYTTFTKSSKQKQLCLLLHGFIRANGFYPIEDLAGFPNVQQFQHNKIDGYDKIVARIPNYKKILETNKNCEIQNSVITLVLYPKTDPAKPLPPAKINIVVDYSVTPKELIKRIEKTMVEMRGVTGYN